MKRAGKWDTRMGSEDKEKSRAKFMADVSHDMKTPLNAVIGFTSVLLQDREKLGDEKAHQLELVYKSAHRLLERLDALTEFFRLEAGVIGSEVDWFSPGQLIEETFDLFRDAALEQGVELRIGPGPLPKHMRSAPKLICRVVRELVSNAVKFTGRGSVVVDVGVQPGEKPETVRVSFSVSDAGPGLGAESLRRLSRALRPADTYEGLGLGLALSREAALRLDGGIEIESRPEKGSRFTLVIELPKEDLEM